MLHRRGTLVAMAFWLNSGKSELDLTIANHLRVVALGGRTEEEKAGCVMFSLCEDQTVTYPWDVPAYFLEEQILPGIDVCMLHIACSLLGLFILRGQVLRVRALVEISSTLTISSAGTSTLV